MRSTLRQSVTSTMKLILTQRLVKHDNDGRTGSVPQARVDSLGDALRSGGGAWRQADTESDTLAEDGVRDRHRACLSDAVVERNRAFDLCGGDLFVSTIGDIQLYSRFHHHG